MRIIHLNLVEYNKLSYRTNLVLQSIRWKINTDTRYFFLLGDPFYNKSRKTLPKYDDINSKKKHVTHLVREENKGSGISKELMLQFYH